MTPLESYPSLSLWRLPLTRGSLARRAFLVEIYMQAAREEAGAEAAQAARDRLREEEQQVRARACYIRMDGRSVCVCFLIPDTRKGEEEGQEDRNSPLRA